MEKCGGLADHLREVPDVFFYLRFRFFTFPAPVCRAVFITLSKPCPPGFDPRTTGSAFNPANVQKPTTPRGKAPFEFPDGTV